jgi:hypothetical protein
MLAPFDQLRLRLLRALGPAAIPLVRDRDLRVTLAGTAMVATAAVVTLTFPWWMLALSPILWGVPHLIADLRYLVIRPGLHRRPGLYAAAVPLLVAGCGFWSVPVGLSSGLLVAWLCQGPLPRKLWVTAILLPLIGAGAFSNGAGTLIFAHAHNFIAVLLWWCWRPRGGHRAIVVAVPALFAGMSLAIGLGWLGPAGPGADWAPANLDASTHFAWLAPGLTAPWAGRLVLLFGFAQAVHYGVWLRLIPEEDRPQPTPRTFASSFRALRQDLGPWLLGAGAAFATGLAMWAMIDLAQARAGYLRMALFHGYVEVAAAAFLFVEGRPRQTRSGA